MRSWTRPISRPGPDGAIRWGRHAEVIFANGAAHIPIMTKKALTRRENSVEGSYLIEVERQRGRSEREHIRQSEKTKRQRMRSTAAIWRWTVAGTVTSCMALSGPAVLSHLAPASQPGSSVTTPTNH